MNTTGWFYPTVLAVFSFAIPWSISLYFVLVHQPRPPSTGTTAPGPRVALNVLLSPNHRGRLHAPSCKWIFTSYTILVTPGLVSSFVRGLYTAAGPSVAVPWAADIDAQADDALDGYLSRLPILFDAFVPLALVYHHKAFRKKCRELYMHGFRNAVSDGLRTSADGRLKQSKRNVEFLADDTPVLYLERSGAVSVRYPSEHGFVTRPCDLQHVRDPSDGKKAVRFSRKVSKATESGESGVYSSEGPKNQESCL